MAKPTPLALAAAIAVLANGTAPAAADGKALYERKCALCHGVDGVPKQVAKGAPRFDDPRFQAAFPAEAVVKAVSEGKGIMPAYRSKLAAEEIQAIAAHVKSLAAAK